MRIALMLTVCLSALCSAPALGQGLDAGLDDVLAWERGGGDVSWLPSAGPLAFAGDQVVTTTYSDYQGNDHTITTPRNSGEDVEDWAQRHKDAVEAIQTVFPVEEPQEEEEGQRRGQ